MKRLKRLLKSTAKDGMYRAKRRKKEMYGEKHVGEAGSIDTEESSVTDEGNKNEGDCSLQESLEITEHKTVLRIGTNGKDHPIAKSHSKVEMKFSNGFERKGPKKLDYKMSFYHSLLPHLDEFDRNEWLYFQTEVVRIITNIKYKILSAPFRLITDSTQKVNRQSSSKLKENSLVKPRVSSQNTQTKQSIPSLITLVALSPSKISPKVSCYKLFCKQDIRTKISAVSMQKTKLTCPPSSTRQNNVSLSVSVVSSTSQQPLNAKSGKMKKTTSAENSDHSDDEKETLKISYKSSTTNEPPSISSISTQFTLSSNKLFASKVKTLSPLTLLASSSQPLLPSNQICLKDKAVDHSSQSDGELEIKRCSYKTCTTIIQSQGFSTIFTLNTQATQRLENPPRLRHPSFIHLSSPSLSQSSCNLQDRKTNKTKSTRKSVHSDSRKKNKRCSSTEENRKKKSENFLDSLSHDEISAEDSLSCKPTTSDQFTEGDRNESEECSSSEENSSNSLECEYSDSIIETSGPDSFASTVKRLKSNAGDLKPIDMKNSNDIQFAAYVASALNQIEDKKTKLITKHNILNLLMQAEYKDLEN
ncbi:hypothetical protein O3M35_010782 [Rhynocoris fuscipes]|uniref:BESS domain-containing protein n=1 Tax=Rhynocoris fuscipes TaxID=488301 RepID=A0AAW1D326_9HEMI